MGVNIQFIKNMNVCLATLAMREINEQHNADNLKKMVYLIIHSNIILVLSCIYVY